MKNIFINISLFSLVSVVMTACVTINIYFPAAAAEKAADKIIEEVWQLKSTDEDTQGMEKANPDKLVDELNP